MTSRNANFVDLIDWTMIPALVDSHVHLSMSGTTVQEVRLQQISLGLHAAAEVISHHIDCHFAAGILAVRDGGDTMGHVLGYKNNHLGVRQSPVRIKAAGRAWHKPDRYGKLIGRALESSDTLEKALGRETEKIDHVKIVNSGLNSLSEFGKETLPQFDVKELKAAVAAANRRGLKIMVHANGRHPVRIAIEAGCHSIEHGFFMGADNLHRLAQKAVIWVPTAFTMKAYGRFLDRTGEKSDIARRNLDHQLEQLASARRYDVAVAVGTDAGSPGVEHGRAVFEEMKLLVKAGYPIEETVRCATFNGARLLGLDDMGLLVPQMPATFIAVKGDPSGLPENLNEPKRLYMKGQAVA
jgi:imidazolonepropionase-like amidohydrolase